MNPKVSQPWIPFSKIDTMMQLEPCLLIIGLCLGAWVAYKLLLRAASAERHQNLRGLFRNLLFHLAMMSTLVASYYVLSRFLEETVPTERALSYIGLFAILSGATVFVKVSRILVFEYLFLSHMRVAVPLLLVNLFTLLLSIMLGAWIITEVFGVRLAPLLATSAIFSIVLGLALQDTLGHLFAGVALQFDKPFEIGDWIEVHSGGQKLVGQVEEISWRATVLTGLSDERVVVPNRLMAQAQVSNYTLKGGKPIIRSQVFRIPYGSDLAKAQQALLEAAIDCKLLHPDHAPLVIASESTESWVALKLVYFVENYGSQFLIADEVIRLALTKLENAGIDVARNRIDVRHA